MQDNTPHEMETTRKAESMIETSKESSHIKSTLLVIETSAKELSINYRKMDIMRK